MKALGRECSVKREKSKLGGCPSDSGLGAFPPCHIQLYLHRFRASPTLVWGQVHKHTDVCTAVFHLTRLGTQADVFSHSDPLDDLQEMCSLGNERQHLPE